MKYTFEPECVQGGGGRRRGNNKKGHQDSADSLSFSPFYGGLMKGDDEPWS